MEQNKVIRINIPGSSSNPQSVTLVANFDTDNDLHEEMFNHIESAAACAPSSIQEFFILLNDYIKNHI
ncbi:hypothetical protein SIO70_00440 [Chitinophaga sancti]|uniref:hypothetical protein n=1 Tax=Chitinophaga sancti TaxID=1004 RepID=UPI002A750FAC|nr:hypothetical protein [Chitinophaga sancti]WPQ61234.1 hypothetical protein SIO70_23015 [Chitinophaga sancti]WPQ63331.1 hypothetical protein SIO70_00440 [Chitinophaga sancti]